EIGIVGGPDDGRKRADFPGGFPNSSHDAFTKQGRTEKENETYDFVHKLLEIRKNSEAIQTGKLIHFPPFDEVYPYLRVSDNETVLVVLNGNKEPQKLNISSLGDHFKNAKVLKSLMTGKEIKFTPDLKLEIQALTGDIFEVK
ncbi:MAG: cyclomaltodextrinase C-terminal domain-containing protein, partial [Bacteroidota bacterium]